MNIVRRVFPALYSPQSLHDRGPLHPFTATIILEIENNLVNYFPAKLGVQGLSLWSCLEPSLGGFGVDPFQSGLEQQ